MALILVLAAAVPARASTYSVTSTADSGPGSLRQAILDANANPGADTIDASAVQGTITLSGGEIQISDAVTITGPGADQLTIQAGAESRIFNAGASASLLAISGMTLTGGFVDNAQNGGNILAVNSVRVDDVSIEHGRASGDGGGIYIANGNLIASDSRIRGNTAGTFDFFVMVSNGGGAYVSGNADLRRVLLEGNQASGPDGGYGGGLYATGSATLSACEVVDNTAATEGGGLRAEGAIDIRSSFLQNNMADAGMAIHGGAAITLVNDTIYANDYATADQSAVESAGVGESVGIYYSTFSGNKTALAISGSAAALTLRNSILYGDSTEISAVAGTTFDIANSLLANASGTGVIDGVNGNIVGRDPKLTQPQTFGGPIELLGLDTGSPAIDAGGDSGLATPPAFDGRGAGFARVVGAAPDMGAFEMQAPTTLIVDTLADPGDGPCDATDCTLREAVDAANRTIATDTVQFKSGLTGTITLSSGTISIEYGLHIVGPGADVLTVDGNGAPTVLEDLGAGSGQSELTVSGLTITGGDANAGGGIHADARRVTLRDMVITGNRASDAGGGVYQRGPITLDNVIISDNWAASDGGGVYTRSTLSCTDSEIAGNTTAAGFGGGFFAFGNVDLDNCRVADNTNSGIDYGNAGGGGYAGTTATVTNSIIEGNSANWGGGLEVQNELAISDSILRGNQANISGGALNMSASDGSFEMTNCLVDGNSAVNGGAIDMGVNQSGVILGSTISNNSASFRGGAVLTDSTGSLTIERSLLTDNFTTDTGDGGALYVDPYGAFALRSSTLVANRSARDGGGIFVSYGNAGVGTVAIEHATISGNTASNGEGGGVLTQSEVDVHITGSIVAGNTADTGNDLAALGGSFVASYSLIEDPGNGDITGGVDGNLVGVDPLLMPLADNGGSTWTRAITSASPAWNAGDPLFASPPGPSYDQRGAGYPRVSGDRIDMGAFESQGPVDGDIIFIDGFEP
ncbi:MAG TPA: choice-of-anchor Q domain-containing protein [Rhodanobacteraceae bacterium]|nr:choice-of-anchor Q domain-containing protein [Rhodanobacteraceae bacterium]